MSLTERWSKKPACRSRPAALRVRSGLPIAIASAPDALERPAQSPSHACAMAQQIADAFAQCNLDDPTRS
jgi:hypothetical protein